MRLSKEQIREIVTSFNSGEGAAQIARRFNIDRSTVTYHVTKYEEANAFGTSFYSSIKVTTQHECIHPSVKCAVCGLRKDTLIRKERIRIRELEAEIARLRG